MVGRIRDEIEGHVFDVKIKIQTKNKEFSSSFLIKKNNVYVF